jgi:hypothetical protein
VTAVGIAAVLTPERAAAHRLRTLERAAPWRRVVRPDVAGRVWISLLGLAHLLGFVALTVAAAWSRDRVPPVATLGAVLVLTVAALGVQLRKALGAESRRRFLSPTEAGLLLALDVGPRSLFHEWVTRPVVVGHAVTLLGVAVTLTVGGVGAAYPWAWALALLPCASAVLALSLAARRAFVTPGGPGVGRLVLVGAGALAAGVLAARVGVHVLSAGTSPQPAPGILRAVVLGLVACVCVVAACLVAPGRRAFGELTAFARPGAAPRPGRPVEREHDRMRAMVESGPLAASVLGVWRSVVVVVALCAGVVVGGARLPPVVGQLVGPVLTGYAFVTILVSSGVVFSVVGPSAMSARLRFRWELGRESARRLALEAMSYPLSVVAVPAAMLSLSQSLMTGRPSLRVLALGLTLVGAAVVAESVLPVATHDDGSVTPHPAAAWLVLVLSAPAAFLPVGWVGGTAAIAYSALVLGVGHRCLSRRILRLPSS